MAEVTRDFSLSSNFEPWCLCLQFIQIELVTYFPRKSENLGDTITNLSYFVDLIELENWKQPYDKLLKLHIHFCGFVLNVDVRQQKQPKLYLKVFPKYYT